MPVIIYEALVGIFTLLRLFLFSFFSKLKIFLLFLIPYALSDILKLLGVGVVTFTGLKIIFSQLQSFIFSKFHSVGVDLLQVLLLTGVDTIISMYFATFSIIVTYKLTTGATSKLVWNKPHGTSNVLQG